MCLFLFPFEERPNVIMCCRYNILIACSVGLLFVIDMTVYFLCTTTTQKRQIKCGCSCRQCKYMVQKKHSADEGIIILYDMWWLGSSGGNNFLFKSDSRTTRPRERQLPEEKCKESNEIFTASGLWRERNRELDYHGVMTAQQLVVICSFVERATRATIYMAVDVGQVYGFF